MSMEDRELAVLLRTVLDEVCADLPAAEIAIRRRVAARIVEVAQKTPWSVADLKQAGREALSSAPTMWR
jgi:hypothetical protein